MKLYSIIIPTLNEVDNIKALLFQIEKVTKEHEMKPEIIFVDDGSTDGTRKEIQDYNGSLEVTLVCRDNQRGLASAVVAGAHAASNETVIVMDADLSHAPEVLPAMLKPLQDENFDMTIGSRYIQGGKTPGLPYSRRLGSQIACLGARLFTSVRDPLSGLFAVKRERLTSLSIHDKGFKIALELLASEKSVFRVKEVPITFGKRFEGSSKMNFTILAAYIMQLARLATTRFATVQLLSLIFTALLGGMLDCSLFNSLTAYGISASTSQFFSLLLASHFAWYIGLITGGGTKTGHNYKRFILLIFLGLFLRGGFLTQALTLSTPTLSTLINIYISSVFIIALSFVISQHENTLYKEGAWKKTGLLLIGYSILLRLLYLGGPELIQEEAYYWNYSQHMAMGYLDHPPMVALLIKFGTLLFGHTEFGVRFGAFLCWFFTAYFSWRLARLLFNKDIAFCTLILVATLPIYFGTGLVSTPDAPLIACWSALLYFLYRALVGNHANSWYPAGIFLGLGLASKYTIGFLGPAIILFMLIHPDARKWFFKPQPYVSFLLVLLVFSPVIWWNYQHNWASFLFQSKERIQASAEFSTHELLISIIILLTPTGFFATLNTLASRTVHRKIMKTVTQKKAYLFCFLMTLVPLSIFILFSISREVKFNWTGPLWLAMLPLIATTMVPGTSNGLSVFPRIWPKTLIFFTLIYGSILQYCAIGLPFSTFNNKSLLLGWENIAATVEAKVEEVTALRGQRPLVVGTDSYKMASSLAFYRYKNLPEEERQRSILETTGRHLFGRDALMYNYWYNPNQAFTKNILVVSPDKNRLSLRFFNNHYHAIGDIEEIAVEKMGKPAGTYYSRLLTWYTPSPEMWFANVNTSNM